MVKFIFGVMVGAVAMGGGMTLTQKPKDVFGTIRTGVDKVEQIQIDKCKKDEASCYLSKSQEECNKIIQEKCGG